jgi:putative ABC transport system permease protein
MSLVRRIANLFARSKVGQQTNAELESHIAMRIEDNIASGMSPQEAQRDALRLSYESSVEKVKSALVGLTKIPRPIVAVLVVLALGLGVNTAFFSGYLQLPGLYPHPDELVALRSNTQGHDEGISVEDFLRWREQTVVFQDLNASTEGTFRIATHDGPENVAASLVTPGFYRMMGDRFSQGYDFIPEDGTPGKNRVVILTHALWKRLGADPALIGSSVLMNGEPYTVVGVLASGLRDRGAPVTVPLVFKPNPYDQRVNVIGRLKAGITLGQAQAAVNALIGPTQSLFNSKKGVSVEPMQAASLANERKLVLWLMLGVVAFVLLIACASVANLLRLHSEAGYQLRVSPSPRFPLE